MCVQASDRADAVAFCEQLRPRLVGVLSLYCGDRDLAEEHVQEVLVRVWTDWDRVKDHPSPEAWAARVGINSVNSWFRRRGIERRAVARSASRVTSPSPEPPDEYLDVRQAVASLPRRQRTALVLRYYLDLSIAEAASQMDCAPGTVKSLTNKALSQLQASGLILEQLEAKQ